MKHETKLHILCLTLPYFLTVIFAVIYSAGIWPLFQLAIVNILCIAFIALELAQAFTERINIWKVYGFIGSGVIGGIAIVLNTCNNTQSGTFTLRQLSLCGWLWIGLLVVSVIALVVILIRIFRWNQEQWEEICKWRQEYRKERIGTRQQLRCSKQELSKDKVAAKIKKQKDQVDKDTEVREKKHEQRMKRFEDWKDIKDSVFKKTKNLSTFVAIIIMAFLFLFIPYSEKLQSVASNWIDAINRLADKIDIVPIDSEGKFFKAFASYIIVYIFFIAAIWLLIFLCQYIYKILVNGKNVEKEQRDLQNKNFLVEYDVAIAVLTVFTALMFALGTSKSPLIDITDKWTALFTSILFILVIFVSIEIVRLVVEQIGQKNSLLKRLVSLVFMAILEFLSGLLLGVIINFRIQDVISSLLTIIFPKEELSFTSKVQEKFNEMFNKELGNDGDDNSVPSYFSKKHIWRRYHKK